MRCVALNLCFPGLLAENRNLSCFLNPPRYLPNTERPDGGFVHCFSPYQQENAYVH